MKSALRIPVNFETMCELPVLNHKGPVEGNKHNLDNHGVQKAFDTSSCLISPDCDNAIERIV